MSKTAKTIHSWQPGAEYLTTKDGEIQPKELKLLRQYIKRVMEPEGLNDFKYYFGTLRHPELSQALHDQHDKLYNQAMLCIKGIRYEQSKTQGITYFARIEYNGNGEEVLRPHLNDGNTIPTVLHLLRLNIATRLRYELVKIREADKRHEEERKAKQQHKARSIRVSTAVMQNHPAIKTQTLDLSNSLLPQTIITEIKQQGLIQWYNEKGQGFNLIPFYWDIVLAIVEINANKSETQDQKSPNFYLGNATEINRNDDKGAHITATFYEIAKQVYGGAKPSGKEQQKIKNAIEDMRKNPKLQPLLIYPVSDTTTINSKGKTERIKRTITTRKPVLEVFHYNEDRIIEGEGTIQTNEVVIRLNDIFVQDIKSRYVELRGDYLFQRHLLSKTLGRRPEMLNDFLFIIRNAWGFRDTMPKDKQGRPVFVIGLLQNANGEPGLFYKLGYSKYEINRNKKRFEQEFNKSIEYLKGLGEILEYAVEKNDWGPKGLFVLPIKVKKSRLINESKAG
jgi:hypothetical protein